MEDVQCGHRLHIDVNRSCHCSRRKPDLLAVPRSSMQVFGRS